MNPEKDIKEDVSKIRKILRASSGKFNNIWERFEITWSDALIFNVWRAP